MNIAAVNGKAGETRSVLRREYLLHTPDAWVRTPMPFLRRGMAVVHASPRLGAGFLQYTAELERGGELDAVAEQRFCWVLEGEASVVTKGRVRPIRAGHYAYLPGGFSGRVTASGGAKLAVIEKRYEALEGVPAPAGCVGREEDTQAVALGGDPALLVRSLLPDESAYDFAVNTMTYEPGAALAQVEIHVMEHGLVMLEGAGTYRLGDERYPVQAGDFIWMAPYCPQWFVAEGDVPAKYLIYKDWNRRPSL